MCWQPSPGKRTATDQQFCELITAVKGTAQLKNSLTGRFWQRRNAIARLMTNRKRKHPRHKQVVTGAWQYPPPARSSARRTQIIKSSSVSNFWYSAEYSASYSGVSPTEQIHQCHAALAHGEHYPLRFTGTAQQIAGQSIRCWNRALQSELLPAPLLPIMPITGSVDGVLQAGKNIRSFVGVRN